MKDRVISPIGVIRNNFSTKFGLPRQSGLANIKSDIVLDKKYSDESAVRGIKAFSHLWIIWGFEPLSTEFSPTVRPPMLGGNKRVGVFATRSPNRPNGLGLTVVKLIDIKREDGHTVITVEGGDFSNGSKVYDVKPYLAYVDSVDNAIDGFAKEKEDYLLSVEFRCNTDMLTSNQLEELTSALGRDPRPQYHEDGREYGFSYAGKEIKFVVENEILFVKEIKDER